MSRLLLRVLTACSAEMPQAASVGSRTPSRTPKPHQALGLASRSRYNWQRRSFSNGCTNPLGKKGSLSKSGGLFTFQSGYYPPTRPVFHQVFILKAVKVVCFDTLLEVLILKRLTLHKNCATVRGGPAGRKNLTFKD